MAPPTDLVPLAWVGLGTLAWALDDGASAVPRAGVWLTGSARGLAFGFGANVVALRFVPQVIARFTPLPFVAGLLAVVLLALAQGLPWAVAGMARSALVRWRMPRPVAFALGVYAATFVPSIFPWTPAGGVTPWPVMIQLADVVGERGVSALLALSAGLIAQAASEWRGGARQRALRCVGLAACVCGAMALHGWLRVRSIEARRMRAPIASIGLVDAAIPATTRWDPAAAPSILAQLASLTAGAERRGALLTVWPESAYPYVLPRGTKATPPGDARPMQGGARGPLLMGAVTRDARGDQYNAALAIRPEGVITAEYDKLHLLWFGEEVPLATELPWLRRAFARGMGMVPGDRPVLLDMGRVKAGVLICFEDILPAAGREAASVSPNLLVNLSNDAWFSGSAESALHLRLSVLRAVEARRDFVRAVNLGPTSWVDATGRVRAQYDVDVGGALVVDVALLDDGPSVYTSFGDWPWLLACAAAVFGLVATKRNERRTTV